jgi:hypothetical protein
MYLPHELIGIVNVFKVTSKTKTSLIMFFGVVTKSRKSDLFNGCILLKPVIKQYKQKKHSTYSNKKNIISISTIINKKFFVEYKKCHFIPAIQNILLRLKGII